MVVLIRSAHRLLYFEHTNYYTSNYPHPLKRSWHGWLAVVHQRSHIASMVVAWLVVVAKKTQPWRVNGMAGLWLWARALALALAALA